MSHHATWIVALIARRANLVGEARANADRALLRHVRAMFRGD